MDYFLRIDGIPGESLDAKHKGEIDVLSWSWGEAATPSAGGGAGGGAGKVQIEDLHVMANTSKASPRLMLACATGQHFKSAVITGRKSGKAQLEFLRFSLTDVLVSDYRIAAASESVPPVDTLSLNFAKIEFRYTEQRPDGSAGEVTSAGWDVKQSKPI